MNRPNFEDFRFDHPLDTAALQYSRESRERHVVRTGFSSDDSEQTLQVYVTLPAKQRSATPLIRLPAWSDDLGRPENGIIDPILANATGRPVISPNAPGVDFHEWRAPGTEESHRLTPDQLEELDGGSFQRVGRAVLTAAAEAARRTELGERSLMYASSMAVAFGGAVIRAALQRGHTIEGLVLAEGVNLVERPAPELAWQFVSQNRFAPGYLAMNPQAVQDATEGQRRFLQRVINGRQANYAYVRALTRGRFLDDAGDLSGLSAGEMGTAVYMTRGSESKLSPQAGNDAAMEAFVRAGVAAGSDVFAGHDHPYTLTLQSILDATKKVA
ncbi:hypothetical protein JNJ66_01920 [Candidatus Saccharibacteria bacterium]|nr:hypothetical protein [Candidatus Saccharibacteria bacterium]